MPDCDEIFDFCLFGRRWKRLLLLRRGAKSFSHLGDCCANPTWQAIGGSLDRLRPGNPDSQWDMDHLNKFSCYPHYWGGDETIYILWNVWRISLVIVHCVISRDPCATCFPMNVPVFLGGWVFKITLWVLACWARRLIHLFLWCLPRPKKWTNVPWKETMLKGHVIFQESVFRGYSLDFLSFQGDYMWRKISLAQLQLSNNFCSTEPMGKELKIRYVDFFRKTTEIRCHDFSICFQAPKRFKDSNTVKILEEDLDDL